MRSSARLCFSFWVVVSSKVGALGAACGVRQVLRTMLPNSASKVV